EDYMHVFDGKNLWESRGGVVKELTDKELVKSWRDPTPSSRLSSLDKYWALTAILNEGYALSPAGEWKTNEHDAVGVKVSKEGESATLYFDRKSHRLVHSTRILFGKLWHTYYSDFRSEKGVTTPRRMKHYEEARFQFED